jgi:hypothetical protein
MSGSEIRLKQNIAAISGQFYAMDLRESISDSQWDAWEGTPGCYDALIALAEALTAREDADPDLYERFDWYELTDALVLAFADAPTEPASELVARVMDALAGDV